MGPGGYSRVIREGEDRVHGWSFGDWREDGGGGDV